MVFDVVTVVAKSLPPAGPWRPLSVVEQRQTSPSDPIASCDVTIDGRLATVRPRAATDDVADLAGAIGSDLASGLWIDGVHHPPATALVESGLRVGSSIATRIPPIIHDRDPDAPIGVAVVAGPSCVPWRPLTSGTHVVGRAPTAEVHVDDPDVELHQGLLEVHADGAIAFTQLTGRVPARIDAMPCASAQSIEPGRSLQIGSSRLEFRNAPTPADPAANSAAASPGGSIVESERDPWRRVVRRGPTMRARAAVEEIAVPEPPRDHRPPPLGGLVGAGVTVAGAGLMAVVLGQAMFALFAAIGATAALATWAVGALGSRRRRRRADAAHRRDAAQFLELLDAAHVVAEHHHRVTYDSVVDLAISAASRTWEQRVWARRIDEHDPLVATLGRGSVRWAVPIGADARRGLDPDHLAAVERCECLTDVAVPLPLPPGRVIALHGDAAAANAVARSIIVQLATSYGPADVRFVIVTEAADEWSWACWLPHVVPGAVVVEPGDASAFDDLTVADPKATLVVTDVPAALAVRTGALRRFLDTTSARCVVVTPSTVTVPAVCDRVLELGPSGLGHWRSPESLGESCIHLAGISRSVAEGTARRLAPLIDPEDATGAAVGPPSGVHLGELLGPVDAAALARRWSEGGSDPALAAVIGCSADGTVDIDLVRDGPHGLIAGTTGAGKSEFLRTLVVSLAAHVSPEHLSFVLIDFKGGATFDACARLPHTVGLVTDLDDGLAERALVSLDAEVRRRERLLRDARADDLTVYRRNATEPLPRLVVIVDEFATLAKELPEVLAALVGIAQRGRSLGVHLLLATQRPAGVVTDEIRANTNLRIALRLHDRTDAVDVVGDRLPATFHRNSPGRAALRLGPDDLVVFQAASCTGPIVPARHEVTVEWRSTDRPRCSSTTTELDALVTAAVAAAQINGLAAPRRPWVDPLPGVLDRSIVAAEFGADSSTVGVIDDPSKQRRRPLRWTSGNLVLIGALGSGTTTTAIALAAARLRDNGPDDMHMYVVDGRGEPLLDPLAGVAHCGGVVRCSEAERIDRLLRRLTDDIDRRTLDHARRPEVILVVDGFDVLRTVLSSIERLDAAARLERVIQEGPGVGIVTCATTDGSSPAVIAAAGGARWVLHVDDPSTARAAGLRTTPPPAIPGRLCLVESGLVAQVAFDPEPLAGLPRRADGWGPPAIGVLPAVVDPDGLVADEGRRDLLVGTGADDLLPAALRVPAGDHVFIGGAAATGKSTALRQLERAWREVHPAGAVTHVDRHHPLDVSVLGADEPPVLIVVDDADRVDDTDGHLAAVVAGRRPGATVIAAARLDAVRVAYGHWVRDLTRSRCGLIMTSVGEVDGELLGVVLPRRSVIPPRPGLGWLIDAQGHRLVQVAARMPT